LAWLSQPSDPLNPSCQLAEGSDRFENESLLKQARNLLDLLIQSKWTEESEASVHTSNCQEHTVFLFQERIENIKASIVSCWFVWVYVERGWSSKGRLSE
jgi:hypothetical protein